jgi:hypothetical protein
MAESAVHSRMPELWDRLNFDAEAGTFVVNSSDLSALKQLAEQLHQAFHNKTLLDQLIREADPDLMF